MYAHTCVHVLLTKTSLLLLLLIPSSNENVRFQTPVYLYFRLVKVKMKLYSNIRSYEQQNDFILFISN